MHHVNEYILTSSENKDVKYYYNIPVVVFYFNMYQGL